MDAVNIMKIIQKLQTVAYCILFMTMTIKQWTNYEVRPLVQKCEWLHLSSCYIALLELLTKRDGSTEFIAKLATPPLRNSGRLPSMIMTKTTEIALKLSVSCQNKKAVLSQRWPRDARYKWIDHPLRRYGHSKLSKTAVGRHLGFDVTRNSAIWSADLENPTLEPNMKCIGSPVAEIWPFAYLGAYGTILGEGEVVGVSDGIIRKSDGDFL